MKTQNSTQINAQMTGLDQSTGKAVKTVGGALINMGAVVAGIAVGTLKAAETTIDGAKVDPDSMFHNTLNGTARSNFNEWQNRSYNLLKEESQKEKDLTGGMVL